MPLQRISFDYDMDKTEMIIALHDHNNHLVSYINALEARLSALEHPVERLSDEE